jgi:Protein kinase domain
MVSSGTLYGVLSSYDTTWFTYRDASGGHFISAPIQFDAQDPTPLECIAFLCAQGLQVCHSPGRIRSTSTHSETKKRRLNEEKEKEGKDDDCADDNWGDSSDQASLRFDLGDLLGAGRCKVFEERTFKMALKLVDAYKNPDLVKELHHEADVYRCLDKLQGVYIPKLVWSGTVEGIFEGIGISPIGTVPSSLSSKQKQHLIDGLRAIHKFGFLHGDLKMQNILVSDNDTAFISDFGFSVPNANKELFEQERSNFQS